MNKKKPLGLTNVTITEKVHNNKNTLLIQYNLKINVYACYLDNLSLKLRI